MWDNTSIGENSIHHAKHKQPLIQGFYPQVLTSLIEKLQKISQRVSM